MDRQEMRHGKYLRAPVFYAWLALVGGLSVGAQEPATVDTSKIGPQVGAKAQEFEGRDQNGIARTLKGAAGPNGTMLVFFRSADW